MRSLIRIGLGAAMAAAGCAPVPVHLTAAPLKAPAGTVFQTGETTVAIGPGGVFSPDHLWVRPGARTRFINRDRVPHTVTGFGGATSNSGPLAPGGVYTHGWRHPGTWTFHDTRTPNAPTFYLTDMPAPVE